VEGLDFDESAVAVAKAWGINVQEGTIEQQAYPGGAFDAVVLVYVL